MPGCSRHEHYAQPHTGAMGGAIEEIKSKQQWSTAQSSGKAVRLEDRVSCFLHRAGQSEASASAGCSGLHRWLVRPLPDDCSLL